MVVGLLENKHRQ